jgi:ADP-ribosylglycohydrolase
MNHVADGLFGLCVGDALGVPVEFQSRKYLHTHPVTDMIGYGTHNQPPGTWSDDSSLAFCLAESLCEGYDLADIANKFCRWTNEGYWTPHGHVFDIGIATRDAIARLDSGVPPAKAGGTGEYSNGNGSLMRILPLAYSVKHISDPEEKFSTIHDVSCLTHAHPRSQTACSIYIETALNLLEGKSLKRAYKLMKATIKEYYQHKPLYACELPYFSRILDHDIADCTDEEIRSTGYVVHTLEAGLWCLLTSTSYPETVLKAVNLGEDTDTTGAVVGGLAGIAYGIEAIPSSWIEQIAHKDDIRDLANRLHIRYGA